MTDRRPSAGRGTLVETVRWRAEHQADNPAIRFLTDGDEHEVGWTYAQLDRRACAVTGLVQSLQPRGERVLLVYPPGLEFVTAFLGCLYAGAVPVVLPPPSQGRIAQFLARLSAVHVDATPSLALTTLAIRNLLVLQLVPHEAPPPARWLVTGEAGEAAASMWHMPAISLSDLAFLQYTSGSTSEPNGVMVSHGNLVHNFRAMIGSYLPRPEAEFVSWLPHHHDMGLIGGILTPLHLGAPVTLLSPVAFIQRPARWLRAIARARAAVSGGPNFAYEHCVRRIPADERASLDLSEWDVALCGAEPISARTLHEFTEAFAPSGFRPRSFKPSYGLAEATLMVSAAAPGTLPVIRSLRSNDLARHEVVPCGEDDPAGAAIPSCGQPVEEVVIVNPDSCTACPPGRVGEIWVTGPSVALGYWNRPQETAATFAGRLAGRTDAFLRTGDLGFVLEGELFVTGRRKDLIIVDGANHYPQDIERTVAACHPDLEPAECAAFSVAIAGREEVVVVTSPDRRTKLSGADLQRTIRTAVAEQHDLRLHEIVLVKFGRIPRTTSGKIRRGACRRSYLSRTLDVWSQS